MTDDLAGILRRLKCRIVGHYWVEYQNSDWMIERHVECNRCGERRDEYSAAWVGAPDYPEGIDRD